MYRPDEIVVVRAVREHPVTRSILERCSGVPVRVVNSNWPEDIKEASRILSGVSGLAGRIEAGKRVLALISTADVVDPFDMPDPRMGCPHFWKLRLASNGCPFACRWCYLRLTYRDRCPYMAVRVKYEEIEKEILRHVNKSSAILMFNIGELQDGLALEHLIGATRSLIPFFAQLRNAYLFILTKSDNVDPILGLRHNGHTILAWSLNAAEISCEFEVGAPSFERRLCAAKRAQEAGYPIRFRLDPILPLPGWKEAYGSAIYRIFEEVAPERVTLGTLRFEEAFMKNRNAILGTRDADARLLAEMERMVPMLPPARVPTRKPDKDGGAKTKESVGKYSYPEDVRVELFRFAIGEIRRYSDGPVALCKEVERVWRAVGLDPAHCKCVCQFGDAKLFPDGYKVSV